MTGYLLRSGLVVGPDGEMVADVRVEDGRISEVGPDLRARGDAVELDCRNAWIGPGFVDLHTHLREPGFEYKEDVASGSAAAAAGGYTAVVAMPNTDPPIDTPEIVRLVAERGERAGLVDVRVAGTLTRGREGKRPAPMRELFDAGVRVFTDDGDTVADDDLMERVMEEVSRLDALVSQHAVDPALAAGGHMRAGAEADRLGVRGIPAIAEAQAIARDIELARHTGCRYHVQHLSTAGGVALVAGAKDEGLSVTAEVTPHHLAFDVSALSGGDGNFKMMPPLGTAADRVALREGLRSGVIDAVATDHAPHAAHEKEGRFEDAAFGVLGLADAAAITHTTVGLEPRAFFERMSVVPARLGRVAEHGRWVEAGAPANLVVFDPYAETTPTRTFSRSRNSPYVGKHRRGHVRFTLFRGALTRDENSGEPS